MVELLEMHRTTACSHDFFHHQSLLKQSLHPVTSLVLWSVAHLVSVGVQCNFRERIAFYKWWRSQTKQYKIIRSFHQHRLLKKMESAEKSYQLHCNQQTFSGSTLVTAASSWHVGGRLCCSWNNWQVQKKIQNLLVVSNRRKEEHLLRTISPGQICKFVVLV